MLQPRHPLSSEVLYSVYFSQRDHCLRNTQIYLLRDFGRYWGSTYELVAVSISSVRSLFLTWHLCIFHSRFACLFFHLLTAGFSLCEWEWGCGVTVRRRNAEMDTLVLVMSETPGIKVLTWLKSRGSKPLAQGPRLALDWTMLSCN